MEKLIEELAGDLKQDVQRIESSPETTQYHYGDYGALLSAVAKDKATAGIIALALIKAGASRLGVAWALRLFT